MKRFIVVAVCLALAAVFISTTASAFTGTYTPGTGINGTVHDLRKDKLVGYPPSPDDYLNRICIFCHAPHHAYRPSTAGTAGTGPIAPTDYTYLPLWNHKVTAQAFQPYFNGPDQPQTGAKRANSMDNYDRIGAVSLLCLSCHDGTIAVNEYGANPQDTKSKSSGGNAIADQYKIGKDGYLANHHPIGFDYDAVATADAEIKPSSTTIGNFTISQLLYGGKMECATCHAVHNKNNSGEKLLYVTDKNSGLCLTCHDKGTVEP
jgi:predicted CXXCH cytochrome family protein